ncbi:MAG: diacylglycerol kinase family protein [Lautropia sp.]
MAPEIAPAKAPATAPTDAPVHVVLNPGSGRGSDDLKRAPIEKALRDSGRRWTIHPLGTTEPVTSLARRIAELAQAEGAIVVVAGGDGTISTVARELVPRGVTLGVVPEGTFNLLARDNGIPEDPQAAMAVVLEGQVRSVQAGAVNGTAFFVNGSIGWYPQLLADREDYKRRLGRTRLVAAWAAVNSLRRQIRPLDIEVDVDGEDAQLHTPTLFVGNNRLQLARVGYEQAREVEHGRLLGLSSVPVGGLTGLRLLAMGALGLLDHAPEVRPVLFRRLVVHGVRAAVTARPSTRRAGRRMTVALDGELHRFALPLRFEPHPQALRLIVPHPGPAPDDD